MRITDSHLEHYRRHGYLLVEPFLTADELGASLEEFHRFFPRYEEFASDPERYAQLPRWFDFPFGGGELATIATHPELLSGIERILATGEVQFGGASIGAKYAGVPDEDQDLHIDGHGRNSLAYPSEDGPFGQLQIFYYLSDVTEELAPTYLVSREHTRGEFLVPPDRRRQDHPWMYELERPAIVTAGTLLIMSMRTFHRGSALRAESGARFVMALTYHGAAARWLEDAAWPNAGPGDGYDNAALTRWLERATPRQREAIGFPPPGHPYWNQETLAGVAARFPGMDMAPYTPV